MRRLVPKTVIAADTRFVIVEEQASGVAVGKLFADGRALMTSLVWCMWFMNLIGMFFVQSWLPTVVNDAGLPVSRAVLAGALFQGGGIIGCLCFCRVALSINACAALGCFYLLGAVSIAVLGRVADAPVLVLVGALCAGIFVPGAQISANAVTTRLYPTVIGATGISWAFGIGRTGSMLGPLLGGVLLSLQLSLPTMFLIASIPGVIAAASAFLLIFNTAGRATQGMVETDGGLMEREEKVAS
jgi:AAHS family 4-hydroxybenzoate transporter-like MFS transporter